MAKDSGVFGPAAEQPLSNWLTEMARARSEEKKLSFGDALAQIKAENPRVAEAARIEASGGGDTEIGSKFLQLMRRALEIAKSKGLDTEAAMESAAVENPDLAAKARQERGGSLYASELQAAPGIGDRRVLMSEGIEASLDPGAELVRLAETRCKEKSVSFAEAMKQTALNHPLLARASREQATGRKLY